ncbi:MAG: cytochrome bc complex cytochrome b subunit [SAR202 cluster bacterium]|nr:cytochrome bc complex cytochrome b subunit [SAR202 cluster bacterium]
MKPARAVAAWLEDRTGWSGPLRTLLRYPVPIHAHRNPMFSLGSLAIALFLIIGVTGMLMAFYYEPSPEGAYQSTDYIQFELPAGSLIRGIHYWGASFMVVVVVLHMLRVYLYTAYKRPRELTWMMGVVMLLIVVSFGFSGYLLPWDQKAYWATKIGTNMAGTMPIIGDWSMRFMRGGAEMGQATLTRFFAFHVFLLPGALIVFIAAHIALMRRNGLAPPLREAPESGPGSKKTVPFYPDQVLHEAVLILGVVIALVVMATIFPAPLEVAADPTDTSYVPRPAWYLMFYFKLLAYVPGRLESVATVLIPVIFFGTLALLPFFDTSEERRPWKKPWTSFAVMGCGTAVIALTILGYAQD